MISRKFANFLLLASATAILALILIQFWLPRWVIGGQHAISPNGQFRIDIMRQLTPRDSDPYRLKLTDIPTDTTIRTLQIHPVGGFPNQSARESPSAIKWHVNSAYADIILNETRICRIYTDNQ